MCYSAHLADAFSITLPPDASFDIELVVARAALSAPSPWFRVLQTCRHALVTPFGIKSSTRLPNELRAKSAAHVSFFPIVSLDTDERVIGDDDSHLDFVSCHRTGASSWIIPAMPRTCDGSRYERQPVGHSLKALAH
ncbi:DUF2867 domain-containing protein [Burkholderia sp. WP9]|uniref:DUF2867 domain-containing protein n=1 Tax=Burkholderia sp. WP9 TaxID=1500263 RepID=UPI000B824E7A